MLTEDDTMPIGPYRGWRMLHVPPEHLLWVADLMRPTGGEKKSYRQICSYVRRHRRAIEWQLDQCEVWADE